MGGRWLETARAACAAPSPKKSFDLRRGDQLRRVVFFLAFGFFALAALAGLAIVVITGFWWLLSVGAIAIVAAWFYTGGKNPYGYAGLGELAVFVFFGLVAAMGTAYIQIGNFDANSLFGGAAIGLFAAGVLMI